MNLTPSGLWTRVPGVLLVFVTAVNLWAGDWPMWRYDAGHTAVSPDELPDELHLQWIRQYSPREPVWDNPLNRDMMPYDRIFEPVVAGGKMFLGFNDADKVVALDVRDGTEIWTFYAEGPVRFSPVVYKDAVLFSSDDGYLYCVGASDGDLRWRFRGGPSERKVLGNRRVISSWPARGGPVVADGVVYFAASIWPFMGTFIYALDAQTGEVQWVNDDSSAEFRKQPHGAPSFAGIAPQGQLAVSDHLLLVPGGRTLPAAFDRDSGNLRFFDFGGKGQGGSFVAADRSRVFAHTRFRGTMALKLPDGGTANLLVNEPVLAPDMLYTAKAGQGTETPPRIEAYDADNELIWHIEADGTGDLILAGSRLYAAGYQTLTAIDLPGENGAARVAWSHPMQSEVLRLVAASQRLFAVTLDGQIIAFGGGNIEPRIIEQQPTPLQPTGQAIQDAKTLLETTGEKQGYAIWFGVDDATLLEAVAVASELHIAAVDPDSQKVARLRRQLDQAGLLGKRIALHVGTPDSFMAPPYIASLVVVGQSMAEKLVDPQRLRQVYESVRPYGGKLWIRMGTQLNESFAGQFAIAELPKAKLTAIDGALLIIREGSLPGSADWSHAYGDVANTVKSNDRRVKLPLGLLWFGGNSNQDMLPRHGHGPSEQVVGGRLFIEGINSLSARDVYTGRVLWKRDFEDLGTFQVYYDETYADTPLSTAYTQVHIPGANARGTNYVATDDGVYLVVRDRCLLLDAASGQTLREFVLPAKANDESPTWAYVGVYQDLLLAGVGFGNYSERLGYEYAPKKRRGPAWGPDRSGSLALLAFDRHSGKVLWAVKANHSFLHNGIVAGGGRVYLLDKLPKRVEEHLRRRGAEDAADYRMLAIDAQTGKPIWTKDDDVFGTWLGYSAEHDVLLQAGAAASDRSLDEEGKGMAVYRAADGTVLWRNDELAYAGPCILYGDTVITNNTSYKESKGAFSLLDGSPITIEDPVTGEPIHWNFLRTYGCNTAVASENLLTFRSGAAGFYDLANHGGTGNFGGFKSGCTSNLIVANGVLNAPDYTRTCTCGYQNQTSLAFVPMPENEIWTYSLLGRSIEKSLSVRRIGINLGAPGDRLSDDGTLWVNYPPDSGSSPKVAVTLEGDPKWFRNHSGRISDGNLPWVAASGAEGVRELAVRLAAKRPDPAAAARQFTVSLYFVEPNKETKPGERVFDVAIQGKTRIQDFDVVAEAGGSLKAVVRTWQDIAADEAMEIALTPRTELQPVLCGVEIIEQKR
ncbi:MAG: PQQ-binding-like beta-propeller repeat protein [Planctomycetes bacterium]|nr:PQQ-binding-like beta-propeller repeat protein [Planctomycetota bacterium]MBL7039584.1 PQQ-binding-like beta-propeller repeat protein [Pirellulaceae bacterium]